MKLTVSKIIKYAAIGIIAVLVSYLLSGRRKDKAIQIRDYEEIASSGILNATTEYNSISFFADGDSINGFHYNLVRAFARDKGLEVNVVPEMSFRKRFEDLKNGTYDIIAYGIPLTNQWKDSLLLTRPISLSKQILVQRKPDNDSTSAYIKSQVDLAHKTLYLEKGSPSILRISNMGDEIADTIYVEEVEKYGQEQLIAMVAHGDIDYAVADENIALASIDSFPQLDINTGISFTQFYGWGVNKESPALLDTLNNWLNEYMKGKEFKKLYKKYFQTSNQP